LDCASLLLLLAVAEERAEACRGVPSAVLVACHRRI